MPTTPPTKDMLGRTGLMTVEEAQTLLLNRLSETRCPIEKIPLEQALDRILAESIHSPENLPPQARSVMDGFAVKAADTFGASESMPCYLDITGQVDMGALPEGTVEKGKCYRIATGGFLPQGADSVVMFEHTIPVDDSIIEIVKSVGEGTNIINTGEDICEGQQALEKGKLLRPQDLGLLAALGLAEIPVFKKVRVGIVSTGDEIIEHHKPLTPGKIRDINSMTLAGMVQRNGGIPTNYGIVSDTRDIFFPALTKAVHENDIVLFSGGSSVGVRDLGEQAVETLGPPGILVHGVALKPGKPVLIGLSDTTPLFGLPGHPVSALVCFDLFVAPAIQAISGRCLENNQLRPAVTARLSRNLNSAAGRLDIVRVRLQPDTGLPIADPVMGKSGAISTLSGSDGFFIIDEDSQGVAQDSVVTIYRYQ
ncbi:gephyrin-like molybdotransferase Glp [Desulfopila sp. IMCC35008]|uniref:molybdopterin molybdotransferase MoeA n=1 Tax=Desulfopila sp. IMCC35008 TaxID=2653858 RepID=UPI0013D5A7A3|nr:gephyrin-like molybdotransferase Glp [Desulfopila sp. IMCC35008]